MGRTWFIRIAVVTVLAVLVGAWAVGLVGLGDSPSPAAEDEGPSLPNSSTTVPEDDQRWTGRQETPRRTRDARTQDAVQPIVDTADEPATDAPSTSDPTSPSTPDSPDPSDEPSDSPSNPPSNPPTQPAEECTDLSDVLDCVLDPITGGP